MNHEAEFHKVQYQFTAYIRDPDNNPAPQDIDARRMKVYSELFYNNVEDFMSGNFPVLREIYSDEAWHALIRDYFSHHQARTPLFPEMPREFLYYLEHEREAREHDYPFMLELAHYEWVESVLYMADEEQELGRIEQDGDLLNGLPVLSSLAWLLSYQYPVHRIGTTYLPSEAPEQPTYIMVYRDSQNEIQYMELNPVTMRLLQILKARETSSAREALESIADELQHPQPQVVIDGGLAILQDLRQRGVILGTEK
ncbi:MAG: putative DNA-binding domain-containing protein [Gammaproteobacteria bacterium]|nr:putative DNA-binding domain-containing protein [Gammaproteobacteria bacterium]